MVDLTGQPLVVAVYPIINMVRSVIAKYSSHLSKVGTQSRIPLPRFLLLKKHVRTIEEISETSYVRTPDIILLVSEVLLRLHVKIAIYLFISMCQILVTVQ